MYPADPAALPEQATDLLRALLAHDGDQDAPALMDATGQSERAFGKAIRRLVTLRLVNMPVSGRYALTERGREALVAWGMDTAPAMPVSVTDDPSGEPPVATPAAATPAMRELSVLVAEELVAGAGAILLAGFNAPRSGYTTLQAPRAVVLRVSAPGAGVSPAEQPLAVPAGAAAGPVRFKVTPSEPGHLRVSLHVLQPEGDGLDVVDGLFFELRVQPYPTPRSAEFQSLGAVVHLRT